MSVEELLRILGPGTGPALAGLFVLLWRRDIVFGWQYKEMREDRDYWRDLHQPTLDMADKSASTAERAVQHAKGEG